jgi:hypothetical protein
VGFLSPFHNPKEVRTIAIACKIEFQNAAFKGAEHISEQVFMILNPVQSCIGEDNIELILEIQAVLGI